MTDPSPPARDSPETPTLLALVGHERNRRLLVDHLDGTYEVRVAADGDVADGAFDLCLVDPGGYRRHRDALRTAREAAAPTFLPALFLVGADEAERLPASVWDDVDDVVTTPIDQSVLTARVENLLERRHLSAELARRKQRSDARFESLFDAVPDPTVVVTPDGTVTEVNEAFAALVGSPRGALVDRPFTDLDFDPREPVDRVLFRVVDDEDLPTVEWPTDDGPLITELSVGAVTSLDDVTERIGVFRDVTALARREADLRRQNEHLEQFARTASHDLRNPLAIAKGHLDLARETGDPEHFEAVSDAHDRMERLVTELLDLAKEGHAALDPTAVSVAAVAREAWALVETDDATLSVDDVRVEADRGRLLELFENLFRNAVEHARSDVAVTVGRLDGGFYVADDGPGIPDSDADLVFQAGYTTAEGGSGFGLRIVSEIAEGHGWSVSLASSSSGGARFEVRDVDAPGEGVDADSSGCDTRDPVGN